MVGAVAKDPLVEFNTYAQVQYDLPEYPRQVRIETASFCPNSCDFCHAFGDFKPLTRKKGKMTNSMYQALIEDIAGWEKPLYEMVPVNFGELWVVKDWEWMLHLASARLPKTRLTLVTTGTMLTPERVEKLAQVPTLAYVNFSINAFFVETWTRILGVPEKYMKIAISAVHALRDRRPDVEVNVSMVHDPALITELEKDMFLQYWSSFGPVTISTVSYAGNPHRLPSVPVTLSCRSVFDGLVVFNNGLVGTGCCFDGDADPELSIGSFPQQTLMEIWRSDKLKGLCEIHNSGQRDILSLCKTCSFA